MTYGLADVHLNLLEDERFICSHQEFWNWADGRRQLRMEFFYREMRRKTGLLMDGSEPEGGKWNFDAENRKPAADHLFMPRPLATSAWSCHAAFPPFRSPRRSRRACHTVPANRSKKRTTNRMPSKVPAMVWAGV